MKRKDLVKRVNQRLDGAFSTWEEMKYEFDDAINEINIKLHTNFPDMSEILIGEEDEYKYFIITVEDVNHQVFFHNVIDKKDYVRSTLNNRQYSEVTLPVIPREYIQSIVVPYVVMRMLQREDEYGNLQSTMQQDYMRGLETMFANYYTLVPEYFIKQDSDMEITSRHNHDNPFMLNENKKNFYDPFN